MKKHLLLTLFAPLSLSAQFTPNWTARYNGAGDFSDKVTCVTRDIFDTMYVGGYTTDPGNEKDFLVMKIGPQGDTIWTRTFDGSNHGHDEAAAIGYDANGFIYAAGYVGGNGTGNDVFTVKMTPAGDTVWTRTYNYTTNLDDQANALTIDGSGNVIVTGQSNSGSATTINDDYITIKYSSSGTQVYAVRFNGTGLATDRAIGCAAFPSGNVVVTGRSRNAFGDDDYVTKCYSPTGSVVWTAVFDGGGNNDRPADLVTDGNNNVYITGQSSNGQDYDYATVEYTMNGAEVWRDYYDNIVGNDYGEAIAVNGNGYVAVTGRCDITGNPNYDIYTIEYDNNGNRLWVTPYNGPGSGDDDAADIVIDASNNVLVAGKTDMNSSVLTVDNDMVTIYYNSTGVQQWAQTSGIAVNNDGAAKISYDNSGNYIVYGNVTGTTTLKDIRRIKYSPAGSLIWVYDYNGRGDHSDVVNAMCTDASGNSYMCGYTYSAANKRDLCVSKVSPAGTILWTSTYNGSSNSDDEANAITVDASGNVYVTGFSKDTSQGYNFITMKLNTLGGTTWARLYNSPGGQNDKGECIAVDASGNVYVTGESDVDITANTNYNIFTIKYSSLGAQQWTSSFNGSGNLSDKPSRMELTATGDIIIGGKAGVSSTNDDAVILKINNGGTIQWSSYLPNTAGNDVVQALDISPIGLIAAGVNYSNTLNDDIAIWVLDNSGTLNWDTIYDGANHGNDRVSDIRYDASGNLFVCGISDYDTSAFTSNYDLLTMKFGQSHQIEWIQHFDGINHDDESAAGLAIDNSTGYVYVLGQTNNGTLLSKNKDFVLLQYDPAGNLTGSGTYDGGNGTDTPQELQIQGNNIFVAGTSNGALNAQKDMVMLDYTAFNVGISNSSFMVTGLDVFPVPSSDQITIDFGNEQKYYVNIFGMDGQLIRSFVVNGATTVIDISDLADGVYKGTVQTNGEFRTFTFIRN